MVAVTGAFGRSLSARRAEQVLHHLSLAKDLVLGGLCSHWSDFCLRYNPPDGFDIIIDVTTPRGVQLRAWVYICCG